MAKESPEKVLAAYDQLAGLVEDTRSAIGEVAEHGYEQLKRSRALRGRHTFPDFEEHFEGIFTDRRQVRVTRTPQEPLLLDNTGVEIDRTATVTFKEIPSFWDRPFLSDEVTDKLVVVSFHSPEGAHSAGVSTKGNAYFDRRTDFTLPKQLDREKVTDRDKGYGTRAYALHGDYATSFLGALGTTLFVAESLDRVHGIVSDTASVRALTKPWQNLHKPRTMHPVLASRLPSV